MVGKKLWIVKGNDIHIPPIVILYRIQTVERIYKIYYFIKKGNDVLIFFEFINKIWCEVLSNQLVIDKTTYFTILIGQITVYGIMLTFYQFVVSFQNEENFITSYLGENIAEYLNRKELKIYKRIISKKLFNVLFMLEILYKPFLFICGNWWPDEIIRISNFFWFGFAIFYFVIFVILFFECTKVVFEMKLSLNVKNDNEIMLEIEDLFLKSTAKIHFDQRLVDLLARDFDILSIAIKKDNNSRLQERYNALIARIFRRYILIKEAEIDKVNNNLRVPKNQIPWRYNSEVEVKLLRDIVGEKYFVIDDKNVINIFECCSKLIELNLSRAAKGEIDKLNFFTYVWGPYRYEDEVFDVSEWVSIAEKLFEKLPNDAKRLKARKIYENSKNASNLLYQSYCQSLLYLIISNEISAVYTYKKEVDDFLNVFGEIIEDNEVNKFYSDTLRDWLLNNSNVDDRAMLDKLKENNATYLFTYIIMYYSIYRFRTEWKYINLNTMNALWNQHGKLAAYADEVVQRIKKSNIGHRFESEMYNKLMEYTHTRMDNELLRHISRDGMIDMFYIWVIKVCIIDQNNYVYSIYDGNYDVDTQVVIVNELSDHVELMKNNQLIKWINYMRFNTFSKMTELPNNFNVTLKNLLVTNIDCIVFINNIEKNYLLGSKDIGSYLLVKVNDLPLNIRRREDVVEAIKSAFIIHNMSVEEYIKMLEKEGEICDLNINYVQKEKMRRYLVSIF